MSLKSSTTLLALFAFAGCGISPHRAQAGPLIDWLFGRHHKAAAYPVGPSIPVGSGYASGYGGYPVGAGMMPAGSGFAGNYGTYYSSQLPVIGTAGAGYTAPAPSGITAATMPPTLSYVPNYQTNAYRAPVTYYRPILTTDPNTGAQVVAMAPCSSYEYMTQRVPALGRNALFGSSAAPALPPPSQALPTYTLPSGGVPLASSFPSITAPYSMGFAPTSGSGPYSTLQPSPGANWPNAGLPSSVGLAGSYPTSPQGQTPPSQYSYYGSTHGGSSGAYGGASGVPSIPGLVAPQAPSSSFPSAPPPSTQQPGYPQPSGLPQGAYPAAPNGPMPGFMPSTSQPSGIYPPSATGTDPAAYPPTLPPLSSSASPYDSNARSSDLRPQLRSITRQPQAGEQGTVRAETRSAESPQTKQERGLPTMLPIPAPADFEASPRWNPGLLREGDMTAMRPISPIQAQVAGQAKPIHWASFESIPTLAKPPADQGLRPIRSIPPEEEGLRLDTPGRRSDGWKVSR